MTDVDVVVLGRGLGAYAAALTAASSARDADVHLVGGADRPFDRASGLLGVLGSRPDERGPVADPFDAIDALPTEHPYHVLGRDALRAGLDLFDEATGDTYRGGHTDANALVPTLLGNPTPAARYPASMAAGLASRPDDALLVGLRELPDFHAPLAAERLTDADVQFAVDGVTISAPLTVDDEGPPALAIARALDADRPADGPEASIRKELGRTVAAVGDDRDRVGLPAVLGRTATPAIRATLEATLDVPVFEVPLGPPSLPGRRLESTLGQHLTDLGVELSLDRPDLSVQTDESGSVVSVSPGGNETPAPLRPAATVLATGGPAAGGIVADRDGVSEPLLDCHVPQDGPRSAWASADPLGDHRLARFGVRVDQWARLLGQTGDPVADDLFAAGAVLGGYDETAAGTSGGVALASGFVAGTNAIGDCP